MAEQISSSKDTGIIVVDLQADFTELKSGALAVAGTDANYIDAVDKATRRFLDQGNPVYLTQDWHPADHVSFYTNNPGTDPMQVIEIDLCGGTAGIRRHCYPAVYRSCCCVGHLLACISFF